MDNIVYSNSGNGIHLSSSSNDNRIFSNHVLMNDIGVNLTTASNNMVYHNNFNNNIEQAYDGSGNNLWDDGYPSGGNHWSDYFGFDNYKGPFQNVIGSDGIGDIPYIIISGGAGAIDNYPLMEPGSRLLDNYTTLKEGWNLISIPFIQEEQNLTRVLGSIDGWYDDVQWYNPQYPIKSWKHNRIRKAFGNDLFELNETMGFWIHITQPGDTIFVYNGTQPASNQTIQLSEGWNMVGHPSLTKYNRTDGLNNLTFGKELDIIQWFDASTQTWHSMDENDSFIPGRGYWVHSKVECEWEVPL
jgi:parallel beta-helix repeat protein